jgi:hypothetical protein
LLLELSAIRLVFELFVLLCLLDFLLCFPLFDSFLAVASAALIWLFMFRQKESKSWFEPKFRLSFDMTAISCSRLELGSRLNCELLVFDGDPPPPPPE